MDALVPALVAALLAGLGDRPAALAAHLASRGPAGRIWLGALVAQAVIAALAATGASLIAPRLIPEARSLVLALALIAAGAGALARPTRPQWAAERRSGFFAALVGTAVYGLADRTAFLTFAFALRGPSPALAAVGGAMGAVVLAVGGAMLAIEWPRLTVRPVVIAGAALLIAAGLIVGASALRLV